MKEGKEESEKDWMVIKFESNDLDFFSKRLREGRTLNYILTSNYEIHITDQSHKYFQEKNSLQDDDIFDERTLKLSEDKIRTESWPHNKKDRMLSSYISEKLNESFKSILK